MLPIAQRVRGGRKSLCSNLPSYAVAHTVPSQFYIKTWSLNERLESGRVYDMPCYDLQIWGMRLCLGIGHEFIIKMNFEKILIQAQRGCAKKKVISLVKM